jgi:nucleotide-binding universal stress UspA family protein
LVKRILVGTDGSAPAARGVAWAASLASALGVDLVVTAVLTPGLGGREAGELGEDDNRVAGLLDGPWSAPARTGSARVSTVMLEGDPRLVLLDAVVAQSADILVLGSAGTGWFPALHLGHVAHAVAHHCPVPLVIVPPGAAADAPGSILVGLDGSAASAAAVAWTGGLARALNAEVLAVHAHMRERPGEPHEHAQLEMRCRDWTATLRAAGVATRVVIAQGWPASALIELEALEAPGLVVLGARGAGGFKDLRLGSVALGVLQRSVVPVAIVPSESRPAQRP